jgi:hypothetical protein
LLPPSLLSLTCNEDRIKKKKRKLKQKRDATMKRKKNKDFSFESQLNKKKDHGVMWSNMSKADQGCSQHGLGKVKPHGKRRRNWA